MSPTDGTPSATATFCATLVDEWVRCGVDRAVVAPGSRSTPLALALAAHPAMRVEVFHDERSAAFAALGIGMAIGTPAILLCTSGTAATHFHAAVVEAHLSDVPMVVCTADRPPELRDVGAPQTIDQTKLFGDAVRWFHDPGVASDDAAPTWRALAARVVSIATGSRPGPVHLNLPFREPLVGRSGDLPPARSQRWSRDSLPVVPAPEALSDFATLLTGRRGVIVAGRGARTEVLTLARALGWPVLADPLSGLRECDPSVVVAFDPILRSPRAVRDLAPEVVLRVGAPPASKVLAQTIAQWLGATGEILQISPTPAVIDPDHRTGARLVGDVGVVCATLASLVADRAALEVARESERSAGSASAWHSAWMSAETAAQVAISAWCEANWSEQTVARTVTDAVPAGGRLVVSSSMPIRDVEWFGTVTPGATVHSNRGANGIDGVVSTAVGVALATAAPTTLLIGDVAFLHDANGLIGLSRRGVDLTVVVTNNDGGSIFSFLPQAGVVAEDVFETLYGTPHGVSIAHLAAAHGIDHVEVVDHDALRSVLSTPSAGVRIVEAKFPRDANVAAHDRCNASVVDAVEAALSR